MFGRWILSVLLNAITLIVVAQLFSSFHIESFWTAIMASVVLSILNLLVKPLLILFTLPITILTLGLFLLFINAITLMIAQGIMGSSFVIESFGIAFLASFVISFINMVLNRLVKKTVAR